MDVWHAWKMEEVGARSGDDKDCGEVWNLPILDDSKLGGVVTHGFSQSCQSW